MASSPAYLEHATRVASTNGRNGSGRGGHGSARVGDKDLNRTIREWAQTQGYEVAERGRIRADIMVHYHQAHS